MTKVKTKIGRQINKALDQTLRETYAKEASRALNEAVSCPVHGSMELEVTLSADHVPEVSGIACCAKGQAALEKAIKE
jgi:hypothetical protein